MNYSFLSFCAIGALIIASPASLASTTPWIANTALNKNEHASLSLSLDQQAIESILQNTPMEGTSSEGYDITIPLPSGETLELSLFEYSMMEDALSSEFPEFHTYKAVGKTDPTITGRFDYTSLGFRGMVRTTEDTYFFDLASPGSTTNQYRAYAKSAYTENASPAFTCQALPSHTPNSKALTPAIAEANISGSQTHTYRLAVAATGEYTDFHGGSVSNGQAAIVTAINRINEIYDHEIAVQFTLVGSNSSLVYTDGDTDPYSNNDGFAMLSENQTNIDSVIGSSNYDIGHVFSTGGGGIAQLEAPCTSDKAEGVTGSGNPQTDAFWVDYVAHEIGHQMGANHTFNGSSGSCGGNRASSSAYEPGSGTTIMGYAGICGSDNVASNSHDNFHTKSLEEIADFVAGFGSTCGTHVNNGNQLPTANAGNDYTIPQQTPFALTGVGTDGDDDNLTYNWEQYDLGASTGLGVDNGSSPIFRAYSPSSNPVRTFPALSSLIANSSPPTGETLPTTNRNLTFRLTVRDDQGGVTSDDTELTVTTEAGPFAMTSHTSADNWIGNSAETITWDVASTDESPINCENVDILFSSDNGATFSSQLLTETPNDGTQIVTTPSVTTSTGRLKVTCSDNIFFGMNEGTLTISGALVDTPPIVENTAIDVIAGIAYSQTIAYSDLNGNPVTFSVISPPGKGTLSIDGDIFIYTPGADSTGNDSFVIQGNDGTLDSVDATVSIAIAEPSVNISLSGPNESDNYEATIDSDLDTSVAWISDTAHSSNSSTNEGVKTYRVSLEDLSLDFINSSNFNIALLDSGNTDSCIDLSINGLSINIDSFNETDEVRTEVINDTRVILERTNNCQLLARFGDGSNVTTEIQQLPQFTGTADNKLDITVTESSNIFNISIEGPIPSAGIAF